MSLQLRGARNHDNKQQVKGSSAERPHRQPETRGQKDAFALFLSVRTSDVLLRTVTAVNSLTSLGEFSEMGKKSKKGVSRAGKTQRPRAGQGKVARNKSVTSVNSVASKEDLAYDVQAGSEVKSSSAELPRNVVVSPETTAETLSTDGDFDKENATALGSEAGAESLLGTDVHTEEKAETEIIPESTQAPKSEESNLIWSTNIREALSNDVPDEPAVLDVTMDQSSDQSFSETTPVLDPIIESPAKLDSGHDVGVIQNSVAFRAAGTVVETAELDLQPTGKPTIQPEDSVVATEEIKPSESVTKVEDMPSKESVEGKVNMKLDTPGLNKQALPPPESAPVVKSSELPAFDKPASAEAKAKQKDCQCVIL